MRPNFPLSTYSVFAEKNVSQKFKNNLVGLRCPISLSLVRDGDRQDAVVTHT
jgi:hypothetical protein